MSHIGSRAIHYLQKLRDAKMPAELIEKRQDRVIDASLTLIRERAKLKGELLGDLGGVKASSCLLGVPLGHNSSFLQVPAFAPRIREAIWCGSTNSATEEGGRFTIAEWMMIVLMNVISESVKLVMEEHPVRYQASFADCISLLSVDHSCKLIYCQLSYYNTLTAERAVSEKLGGPVDILHRDAHLDIYHCFEGNKYSHASSFARIMEGCYARRVLQKLGEGVKGVYISIDVDCLDPAIAPGVSHIEPGGLSFHDVLNLLHNLQAEVVAADVVEFNPHATQLMG
ncbi:hypothetical protein Tsubulata_038527 [Turnera subulata]|uniref:Arginase n=1 Tax=Turnera subulata TaxID=218843 RepID=A0A9Q0FLS3_9ROSI|nr:hypothetical protein Tsubulata_038527 [Turnera subulata]